LHPSTATFPTAFPGLTAGCLTLRPEPEALASTQDASADDADTALVRRAQRGDRLAMDTLVLRYQPDVARLLWRFARNRTDLEDLVQETFLRIVRGLHGWRADRPFSHWVNRVAANTGRDFCRRQNVRRRWLAETRPPGDDGEAPLPEAVDPGGDPAARAAADEVKALLAGLPPDDRALLTLHHLEGWDLAHIARQFGWTVTATKLRAWRARNRLRALLTERERS